MLFLNRRGYAGFFSCRSCGTVMKCPHCDVSLITAPERKTGVSLACGYETRQPQQCPVCGSPYIGGFRAGTQQIEEIVKKRFPQAGVLWMDLWIQPWKKKDMRIFWAAFANQEADILIGTQMIVKGWFFESDAVGVLAADLSLNISDYRASERTFQLLTQAAGKSRKRRKPGEAIIQTYQPEHYSIQAAMHQDYRAFYEEEIGYRKLWVIHRVSNLLAIHGSCGNEELLETGMQQIKKFLNWVDSRWTAADHRTCRWNRIEDRRYVSKSNLYKAGGSPKVAGKEQTGTIYRSKQRIQEIRIQLDFNHWQEEKNGKSEKSELWETESWTKSADRWSRWHQRFRNW